MPDKKLPTAVGRAFETVELTKEPPSTYPNSRNPRWIYFLKPGHSPSELLRDEAWSKLPFVDFEPYIEPTGKRDSVGRYWRLRAQYR
jgi:hypothetical protein